MREQQYRSLGFAFIIVMMLLVVMTFSRQVFTNDDISYQEYVTALDSGNVERIIIRQNQQTPTGEIEIKFKDSSTRQ